MVIKVCGMREAENIREVENLLTLNSQFSSAMMGFIFWPKSSRYVSEKPEYLPSRCKRVGVFVDEKIEQVCRIANDYVLDYIQLHGKESPEFIRSLRSVCGDGVAIIKAFNIATAEDLFQTQPYDGLVDLFLFDAKGKSVGGNGEKFNWDVLEAYHGSTPFLLSGGIGPDDAANVMACRHPKCMGIDLNSRFELSPALKDIRKLKDFIDQIKQ